MKGTQAVGSGVANTANKVEIIVYIYIYFFLWVTNEFISLLWMIFWIGPRNKRNIPVFLLEMLKCLKQSF